MDNYVDKQKRSVGNIVIGNDHSLIENSLQNLVEKKQMSHILL